MNCRRYLKSDSRVLDLEVGMEGSLEMSTDLLAQITRSIVDGDVDLTVELSRRALEAGLNPMAIIDGGLTPGMTIVGDKFAAGEFFLPNLVIAGNAMQKAMALLEPELRARQQARETAGTVVIGTVKGDLHEIGKTLVATMLSANGFEVHDLGANVPTEAFVAKVKETGCDLLGLSTLLTTTLAVQREVIEALEADGIRSEVRVMVGGAPVTQSIADRIGADGYAEDALGAVRLAQQLLEKSGEE
jgi:corrinoid protein of di/trimethylamine methyltransferase